MKAIYERPLSRADLIALLGHFAGSPYRDRLEQIAAHDDEQREIISAQAREIARLAALLPAQPAPAPAPPASDAVREAAERLRASLVAVPSWEALLPKNCGACEGESDCAGEHEPCGCHETLAVIEASLALLAALRATASPSPGSEGVREAAEKAVDTVVAKYERAIARSSFEKGRLRTAREVSNECAAAVKKALAAKGGE